MIWVQIAEMTGLMAHLAEALTDLLQMGDTEEVMEGAMEVAEAGEGMAIRMVIKIIFKVEMQGAEEEEAGVEDKAEDKVGEMVDQMSLNEVVEEEEVKERKISMLLSQLNLISLHQTAQISKEILTPNLPLVLSVILTLYASSQQSLELSLLHALAFQNARIL